MHWQTWRKRKNNQNGVVTGQIEREGNYTVTFTAENDLGRDEKQLTFEIKQDTFN